MGPVTNSPLSPAQETARKAADLAASLSIPQGVKTEACGIVKTEEEEEDDEYEEMFVETAAGLEWGGPLRGGRLPEPVRFGDWERKGRCSDF